MKKVVLFAIVLLTIVGCSKKSDQNATMAVAYKHVPSPYTIKEDFEMGTKAAYLLGDVTIKTGIWSFDDALLGKLPADIKNDLQSVRLRTGKMTMNFDIDSITMLKINHAQYGTDAVSEVSVWMSEDQGITFTQLGSSLATNSRSFITDSFKISATKKVRFQIRKTGTTRVNIDDIIFIGKGNPNITFTDPLDVVDDNLIQGSTPTAGRGVPNGSGADVPPADGDNSNLLFGNPSGATNSITMSENYLIDMKFYTESYSSSRGTPNWVSWHIDASRIGSTGRLDNFASFLDLPSNFYQVQSNSYSGSGFDRGHNCPSGDRTSSTEANSSTFLMPNMIPQAPNNNQKAWASLESYLRAEVQKGFEVYIIMGSYGKGGTGSIGFAETINGGKIVVPKRVWKVAVILPIGNNDLARVTSDTRVLAIDTPNENNISSDWKSFITTIDAVEKSTSYDLLSKLPTAIQKALQAKLFVP
jgi:endonuclease G